MPWVTLYRDLQKLTDKRKNTCKKLKCHIFKGWRIHLEKSRCQKEKKCIMLSERKKCIRLSERKYCTRPQKKMAYRPAKVHVSSKKKKKTTALDLEWIFSPNIVQSYLCCRPWKQRHLQLYQCQTLSEWPPPKSNNICSRPSRISKNSDKISQKINPQKSSKDFDVQNSEKIINNGATTHGHKFPATRGFLIQICADLRKILQNWCNHSIHRPTIYETWKLQAQ